MAETGSGSLTRLDARPLAVPPSPYPRATVTPGGTRGCYSPGGRRHAVGEAAEKSRGDEMRTPSLVGKIPDRPLVKAIQRHGRICVGGGEGEGLRGTHGVDRNLILSLFGYEGQQHRVLPRQDGIVIILITTIYGTRLMARG